MGRGSCRCPTRSGAREGQGAEPSGRGAEPPCASSSSTGGSWPIAGRREAGLALASLSLSLLPPVGSASAAADFSESIAGGLLEELGSVYAPVQEGMGTVTAGMVEPFKVLSEAEALDGGQEYIDTVRNWRIVLPPSFELFGGNTVGLLDVKRKARNGPGAAITVTNVSPGEQREMPVGFGGGGSPKGAATNPVEAAASSSDPFYGAGKPGAGNLSDPYLAAFRDRATNASVVVIEQPVSRFTLSFLQPNDSTQLGSPYDVAALLLSPQGANQSTLPGAGRALVLPEGDAMLAEGSTSPPRDPGGRTYYLYELLLGTGKGKADAGGEIDVATYGGRGLGEGAGESVPQGRGQRRLCITVGVRKGQLLFVVGSAPNEAWDQVGDSLRAVAASFRVR